MRNQWYWGVPGIAVVWGIGADWVYEIGVPLFTGSGYPGWGIANTGGAGGWSPGWSGWTLLVGIGWRTIWYPGGT